MDPKVLTVYKCPFEKFRLGTNGDGGYIVARIPNVHYTTLLGGGIDTNSSFEEDFVRMFPHVKAYAIDGSIEVLNKPGITFVKKMVSFRNTPTETNLHEFIKDGTFVKMDIEGGEVNWIMSLSDDHLNKLEQIVMEFHDPFSNREVAMFEKLNRHHVLVHFHGNNCCGVRTYKGVVIPNIFECTYLHKKYFAVKELNDEPVPGKLDMKNKANYPEIHLNHAPFVNRPKKQALLQDGDVKVSFSRRRNWSTISN